MPRLPKMGFNASLVRLEGLIVVFCLLFLLGFNASLVRLEVYAKI